MREKKRQMSKITASSPEILKRKFNLGSCTISITLGKEGVSFKCDKCGNEQKISWENWEIMANDLSESPNNKE